LAASVWGSGADPAEAPGVAYVRKWNATANAVEAIAADHCDGLLVLDEIGEAQAHDLGRLIYQLAGGQGKNRLSRDTALRAPRTWRVVVLSTGEAPAQDVIEGAGRRARGGQLVRMVDVPATGDDGDVVHDTHGLGPAEFVQGLKRACATYFGTAGPEFIRYLCRQGTIAELCQRVQQDLAEAHRMLVPQGAAEEVSRVVRRFALVLVAGQLACDAGVLPFDPADIEEAVRLVLRRWPDVHGRGPMERAVEQLRAFVLRNEARFRDRDDADQVVRDLAGYRDRGRGLFLLTQEGAKEALEGYSVQDVMRHLLGRGWVEVNERGRLLSGHRIRGLDRVVRLYAVRADVLGEPGAGEESDKEPDPDD
jgi:putative DNA primase/helicase